jgi:hypothetical protein
MEDKGDSGLLLLQEALDIRRKVFDQVPGAKIVDAKAKLELACEQNNKDALFFKARALQHGGFGYERQCKTVYQPVYEIAKALGCDAGFVLKNFSIELDDENELYYHMWQKYEYKSMPGLIIVATANDKDRLQIFTAAQNGHSECARMLCRLFSTFYTVYQQMSFCIIARNDIFQLSRHHKNDSRLWYMAGKFFESPVSGDFPRCSGLFGNHHLKRHAKDVFRSVNYKCKKSVLAWLSTKVLMKDMMKYIGQIIWNNREIDANKWHKDEEG